MSEILSKCIPLNLIYKFNNCNHYHLRPWIIDIDKKNIYIDNKWLNRQNIELNTKINNIIQKYNLNIIDDVCDNPIYDMNEIEYELYDLYLYNFNYSVWYFTELNPEITMINLDPKLIHELSIKCCFEFVDFDIIYPTLTDISTQIDNILKKYNRPVFVRLDQMSTKRDSEPKPITNSKQLLSTIVESRSLYKNVYKRNLDVKLIIMPWINIDKRREFRIFIYDKKIVAISQQFIYNKFYYTTEEIKIYYNSIINSNFNMKLPYNDVVCDVYVDELNVCHLIECNPFGSFSASGSSLFCWIKDNEILYGNNNNVEFRFTI